MPCASVRAIGERSATLAKSWRKPGGYLSDVTAQHGPDGEAGLLAPTGWQVVSDLRQREPLRLVDVLHPAD